MQNDNSKFKNKIDLKKVIDFHGHLGPYLVLGALMGKLAISKLKAKKHFGLKVIVKGANDRPKSCLIDGLQISTGCTYGKGNIQKIRGNRIQVLFYNLNNKKKIKISLNKDLIRALEILKGHKDSEIFAKKILYKDPRRLLNLKF